MGRAISGPDRENRKKRVEAGKRSGREGGRMMIRKGKKDRNFITEFLEVSMVPCTAYHNVLNFLMHYPSHSMEQYFCKGTMHQQRLDNLSVVNVHERNTVLY